MIRLNNIKKRYADKLVLRDINLTIDDGSIHVLFGANGCGKTTLFKIIGDIIKYDAGSVVINDVSINDSHYKYRKGMGYVFDKPLLINQFTVKRFLNFSLFLQDMDPDNFANRVDDVTSLFELPKNKRLGTLSKGQKMKVAISASLLHQPKHLVLDEPFSGIDLVTLKKIIAILKRMKKNEVCIFLASHRSEIIYQIADFISILKDGIIKKTLNSNEFKVQNRHDSSTFENKLVGNIEHNIPTWIYDR